MGNSERDLQLMILLDLCPLDDDTKNRYCNMLELIKEDVNATENMKKTAQKHYKKLKCTQDLSCSYCIAPSCCLKQGLELEIILMGIWKKSYNAIN